MSLAFLITKQLPTKSLNMFKISVEKKNPFGKWVRTLFEVPNLEYKGRLSVLYSSPETFRLSSCPRDQRARESTLLSPPPRPAAKARLRNLRHRAAELQRKPSASFVLDLGVERLRRHWLSSPRSSLSHLENLRQKSLAIPPAQVALPRLRRKGGRGGRLGPYGAISIGSAPASPEPPRTQVPGLSLLASFPTLIPSKALCPPSSLLSQFSEAWAQKVERGRAGSRGGRATVPKMAEAKPAGKGGMLDDSHFGPRLRPLNSTWQQEVKVAYQQFWELTKTAQKENEAPYFHSRCIHSKAISWESCCCLSPRK